MKNPKFDFIIAAIGLVLLAAGLFLVKTLADPQGFFLSLPYILIGLGCGIFGQGMGNILSRVAAKKHPDIQRQREIEAHDERNTAIAHRAKAKAYDMMTFVFGALMISFALIGVDTAAVLLLVFAYLFVHGYGIYFRLKYDKEM